MCNAAYWLARCTSLSVPTLINMKLIIQPPDVLQKHITVWKNILKTVNHIDVLTADFSLLPL